MRGKKGPCGDGAKVESRQLKREELCGQKQGCLGKGLSELVWDKVGIWEIEFQMLE